MWVDKELIEPLMWGLREKFGLARWLGFESIYLVNSLGAQITPQNTEKFPAEQLCQIVLSN